MFLDVFMDALIDTVKMLPFLYLACLAIEAIEHSHGDRIEQALAGGGRWGCAAGWGAFPSAVFRPWRPTCTAVGSSRWAP